MITLKLFNSVLAKESNETKPYVSEDGYIVEPGALWAMNEIIQYYQTEKLNGNDLNKTFHKSWAKVLNSTRLELALHQILHYMSTYGSNFTDEIYIPYEVLKVPDVKVVFKVIRALSKEELTEKCLDVLRSGMALKEETITEVLSILHDELDYQFTGKEGITNKEAIIQLADLYHIYPESPTEFLRYIVYKSTGNTLLIKDKATIDAIKSSSYNPTVAFKQFGLDRISTIFNRFKPIFLAYKSKSRKTVNKISKLSKVNHKPMVQNPLNLVTQRALREEDMHWLENATPYSLFKALGACYSRIHGQDAFTYRIRNGKSWSMERQTKKVVCYQNFDIIIDHISSKFDFTGKMFYIPKNIEYALPTSEKMYVGNIPTGTKFIGKKLAVGVYWEDSWGANDLDLSGISLDGEKVGWDASYRNASGTLIYSGDITSAPNGAVEYLYAGNGLNSPVLVSNNVFSGSDNCDYKIIVGKGNNVNENYMMNPNKLFAEVKTKSVQKQTILGMFLPIEGEKDKQSFVILNFGAGSVRVSHNSRSVETARAALYQQWENPITLNYLIEVLGGTVINEAPEDTEIEYVDLSLDTLERDTFIKLFKK